jgi:uncharacterized protein GlcG (DUF336 family)
MIRKLFALVLVLASAPSGIKAGIVLSDPFSYADGPITNVSGGIWVHHSGNTLGEVDVSGGRLNLTDKESEDVNALLAGQPYSATSATVLYARFTVNFNDLPSGPNGGYFAHFKDAGTGFRCRIFAATVVPNGTYRLGIASASGVATNMIPTDLSLNTTYTVVARLVVSNAVSTIWLNPTAESDPSVSAADTGSPVAVTAFAFRQASGIGSLAVGNLVVGTSIADVIATGNMAPAITTQPQSQTVLVGANVSFTVAVTGSEPLSYQWQFNDSALTGETNAALALNNVVTNHAGRYWAVVSNAAGSATSEVAVLTVQLPSPPTIASLDSLRLLVDNFNYRPTDTTNLYTAEGIVTTHVNLTGPGTNVLFYFQDDTAGMAVFWYGGVNQFIPKPGDRVRVTAPLGHFNGLLQFMPNVSKTSHSVALISANNPLPPASSLVFGWQSDPAVIDPQEGKYMVASNVFLDLDTPIFPPAPSGGNVNMTNESGEVFVLRIDPRTDIAGQVKPATAVTIFGVLGQYDTSDPRTGGYQLIPTRFADILSAAKAPTIRFTNRLENLIRPGDAVTNLFAEQSLRPGEKLTITAAIFDPEGKVITISAPAGSLPATARWAIGTATGANLAAIFTFQPAESDAGVQYTITLQADNGVAVNTTTWTVYVPAVAEQKIIIAEFLANPATTDAAPHFNPLRRNLPSPNPSSDDEYIELANLSDFDVDLAGWTISDSVQVRHKFYETFILSASNAVVVYGGPLNGFSPNLDVPAVPTSENAFGFGLNNSGGDSILVRNANGNLVMRVVYTDATLSSSGSVTRFPDLNGPFVPQAWVSTNHVSPGCQYDGLGFAEPPAPLQSVRPLRPAVIANLGATLSWSADTNRSYTVWQADRVTDRFSARQHGLRFTSALGQFTDPSATNVPQRFYWISTP